MVELRLRDQLVAQMTIKNQVHLGEMTFYVQPTHQELTLKNMQIQSIQWNTQLCNRSTSQIDDVVDETITTQHPMSTPLE